MLVLLSECSLTFDPFFAVFVRVSETPTPVTHVGEAFKPEGDPMSLVILKGEEPTTTQRERDV